MTLQLVVYFSSTDRPSTTSPALLRCWVYLLPDFPATMLAKPMLESYTDSVEQPYQIWSVRQSDIRAAQDLAY